MNLYNDPTFRLLFDIIYNILSLNIFLDILYSTLSECFSSVAIIRE